MEMGWYTDKIELWMVVHKSSQFYITTKTNIKRVGKNEHLNVTLFQAAGRVKMWVLIL